jgi:hypothetical protein
VLSSGQIIQLKFYMHLWLSWMLPTYHILLDVITLILFGEEYKLHNSPLCNFLRLSLNSSFSGSIILHLLSLRPVYDGVSKSFRTGYLERELLSAIRCSCIAILWVKSSEFCRHNPLCCFSTSVYCCKRIFLYRLSPETFGYTLVCSIFPSHPLLTSKYSP